MAGAGAPLSRRKIAGGKKKEGHPVISLGWVLTVLAFWVEEVEGFGVLGF